MRAALLAVIVLGGCRDQSAPNARKAVYGLNKAKSEAEDIADCVSRQRRPFKRATARDLYNTARAEHNAVIAEIVVTLEKGTEADQAAIAQHLANANMSLGKLVEWYEGGRTRGNLKTCTSAIAFAGLAIDFASLASELYALHQAEQQAELERLIVELRRCEWRSWSEIVGDEEE